MPDGDAQPTGIVTAGDTGGDATASFTLDSTTQDALCVAANGCSIFAGDAETPLATTYTAQDDGSAQYSAALTFEPYETKVLTLRPYSDTTPPVVNSFDVTPLTVMGGQDVTISASLHDDGALASVIATVDFDGTQTPITLTPVDGQPGSFQATWTAPDGGNGAFSMTLEAQDATGNTATSDPISGVVDSEPPALTGLVVDAANFDGDVPLTAPGDCLTYHVTAEDTLSGVAAVTLTITGPDGSTSDVALTYDETAAEYSGQVCTTAESPTGDYTAAVQIADAAGNTASADGGTFKLLTPLSVTLGPDQSAGVGEDVAFSATIDNADPNETYTINWDFGDGGTADGSLDATHAYADAGSYTVTVSVTDSHGGSGSATQTVTVADAPADQP